MYSERVSPEFLEHERPAFEFGIALGSNVLTNEMVESWDITDIKGVSITAESTFRKTGIARRFIAGENQTALSMGVDAARMVVRPGERLDSVVFTTSYPEEGINHADELVKILGIRADKREQVGAACTGLARAFFKMHQNADPFEEDTLIVSSEHYSPHLADLRKLPAEADPSQAQLLFGDGAIVARVNRRRVETLSADSFYEYSDDITMPIDACPRTGNYDELPVPVSEDHFRQNGGRVLRQVVASVPPVFYRAVEKANLRPRDIKRVYTHQPSEPLIRALSARVPEFTLVADYKDGNYSSASILKALHKSSMGNAHDAFINGEYAKGDYTLKSGDTIMIVGFGAGFHAVAVVMRIH